VEGTKKNRKDQIFSREKQSLEAKKKKANQEGKVILLQSYKSWSSN